MQVLDLGQAGAVAGVAAPCLPQRQAPVGDGFLHPRWQGRVPSQRFVEHIDGQGDAEVSGEVGVQGLEDLEVELGAAAGEGGVAGQFGVETLRIKGEQLHPIQLLGEAEQHAAVDAAVLKRGHVIQDLLVVLLVGGGEGVLGAELAPEAHVTQVDRGGVARAAGRRRRHRALPQLRQSRLLKEGRSNVDGIIIK